MPKKSTLMEEVRRKLRLLHYLIHTERSYCDWIRRYVKYHGMRSREDLSGGEAKIEAFLSHLAVDQNVAPSTQSQAMNALVFLYKHVLEQPLDKSIDAIRATPRKNLPVVLTREEVGKATDIRTIQALLGHEDVSTTMIYTHVLKQGGQGVPSPLDDLNLGV